VNQRFSGEGFPVDKKLILATIKIKKKSLNSKNRRLKVSLRKTGDTDSDPYGSKNNAAGLSDTPASYR